MCLVIVAMIMLSMVVMVVVVVVEGMVVIIVAVLAARQDRMGEAKEQVVRDVRVEAAGEEAREQVMREVKERRRVTGREMRRISRVMRNGGGEDDRLIDRRSWTEVVCRSLESRARGELTLPFPFSCCGC